LRQVTGGLHTRMLCVVKVKVNHVPRLVVVVPTRPVTLGIPGSSSNA
jgi:hypothetical protein